MLNTLENIYDDIKKVFQEVEGLTNYNTWLSKLNFISIENETIFFSAPSMFFKKYIEENFFKEISQIINHNVSYIRSNLLQALITKFNIKKVEIKVDETNPINEISNNETISISKYKNLFTIGTELNELYTFENFVVGDSNKKAFELANIIINNENQKIYNPLFLYSEVGLGKTHLIQSIAWALKNKYKNKNIVYLSAEKFMHLYVKSLQDQTINDFKENFRNVDILLIDDLQFIAGKEGTQKEFFYTFNMLVSENKTVVMACNKSPNHLENIDIQLKSKITSGIIVDISSPEYTTRYEIAKSKAKLLGLQCDDEIFKFIAENITTTCRDIEGAIKQLLIEQQIIKTPITIENVKKILKNSFNLQNNTITIEKIQNCVSKFYKISTVDLLSPKRDKKFSYPRQIAFYLCRKLTTKTFMEIATNFNNKNYATIIYACSKLQKELNNNSTLLNEIIEIEKILKNR